MPAFAALPVAEQLVFFDRSERPEISKARRARLRRSIQRGWTIYDPGSDRLTITEAGKRASSSKPEGT